MHVLTIIGNRPQFVKLAAVSGLLRERHTETLVHTGQHHDRELSDIFFEELDLPQPDVDLGIAGGGNSSQVGRMLSALEPLIAERRPDLILVYGDTNSTLAGALAASYASIPSAHVEAGLRSFDRTMPEEINRVLCDELSGLLLCPSDSSAERLRDLYGAGRMIEITGDVMGDVVQRLAPVAAECSTALDRFDLKPGEFALLTAHRSGNVDDPARLNQLVELIEALPLTTVFPMHPRTRARLEEHDLMDRVTSTTNVIVCEPLGYLDTVQLTSHSHAVLTDSGGLQKEAVWLGTPCITLRETTEWTETADSGWNTVTGLDKSAVLAALDSEPPKQPATALYGAGNAGLAVVDAIDRFFAAASIAPGPAVKSA
jgi:UDP-N-acetylglucosamine 2-epimerase (non-hydrolysing)/UDP-GlcNAc3NAcA epimerase